MKNMSTIVNEHDHNNVLIAVLHAVTSLCDHHSVETSVNGDLCGNEPHDGVDRSRCLRGITYQVVSGTAHITSKEPATTALDPSLVNIIVFHSTMSKFDVPMTTRDDHAVRNTACTSQTKVMRLT